MLSLATFASLALVFVARVHAYVYVTNPVQSSQCSGGQSCQVEWVDNGETPLLSQMGECNVALYTGEYQLVQSLPSVDVSTSSSFSFTPNPAAGPNGQYYIVFSSTTTDYSSFSGSFSLTGMTGTNPTGSSSTSSIATSSASSSSPSGSSSSSTGSSASTPSGSSTSGTDTTTPTIPPSSVGSSTSSGTTPTTSATTPTTSHTSTTTSSTSTTSTSPTPSNAAARVGSSASLGGVAALFALSGILAF